MALLLCAYTTVPTFMQHTGSSMFGFPLIAVKSNWEISLSSSRHCFVPFGAGVELSDGAIDDTPRLPLPEQFIAHFNHFIHSRHSCQLTAMVGFVFC